MIHDRALIGGEWRRSGRKFAVWNPADGARVGAVSDGDGAMARAAVDAAAQAFRVWATATPRVRAAFLRRWFEAIMAQQDGLAQLITLETGKPLAEARAEVAYGAAYVEWFAEEAKRADGDVFCLAPPGRRAFATKHPIGVVAVVTPWNFPFAMITRKLAPALAAGCSVVVKPAEDTPLTALAVAALAETEDATPGLVNVVPASRARGRSVVAAWLDDPRVRKLTFTGSTAVGKQLARSAAGTLKRVSLELGGDAPFIVFEDADPAAAAAALMAAKFRNAGQACIAANRVLIQRALLPSFVEILARAVADLTVGPANEGAHDVGPLINRGALEKVASLVKDAVAKGAQVHVGGAPHARGGNFYQPTVLSAVAPDMRLSCEEIFGPVIAIRAFEDEAEAFELANASNHGLAAYVCTRDSARAWRAAELLECGMLGINEGAISAEYAPFGGIKQSGYGREGSKYGLPEYQTVKYVCLGGLI